MHKYWYLGFLGFIGFYKLPETISYFQGTGTLWDLSNILWFLWFLDFLPVKKYFDNDSQKYL